MTAPPVVVNPRPLAYFTAAFFPAFATAAANAQAPRDWIVAFSLAAAAGAAALVAFFDHSDHNPPPPLPA